jgi:hypothetical protein
MALEVGIKGAEVVAPIMRRDALAKLKKIRQDASRRCTHQPDRPDRDPFFIQSTTQINQDKQFMSTQWVGLLKMSLSLTHHRWY